MLQSKLGVVTVTVGMAEEQLVLTELRIQLPSAATAPLQLRIRAADQPPAALASLTVSGTAAKFEEALEVLRSEAGAYKAEICVDGTDEILFASALSLNEMGVGSQGTNGNLTQVALMSTEAPKVPDTPQKGKKSAPPVEVPQAKLDLSWRVQPVIESMREHRCPPLAHKYSATSSREQHFMREKAWREEMSNLDINPGKPAPTPKHFLGDATSRQSFAAYRKDRLEMQDLLSSHAVTNRIVELLQACLRCPTAMEASNELTTVKQFLMEGSNLIKVDADDALRRVKSLRLPRAKLVHNIYSDGPEGEFERTKAYLQRTLRAEIHRRSSENARSDCSSETVSHHDSRHRELGGPRLGLLTFKGARLPRR